MWLTNQKTRRGKLDEQQLARLADLGIDWASGRQGDRSRGQSLNWQVEEVELRRSPGERHGPGTPCCRTPAADPPTRRAADPLSR
ncbi:hypothetical protein [Streptomyces violascens]|uniref:hypothetical protein n=1 Tax=Streptomyces violascens TaxID=67381 RepID=UPI0036480798